MLHQKDQTRCPNTEFLKDVLSGLSQPKKSISCKYFYDERGSKLFEDICDVEEYYLTNCELEIMEEHAGEIAKCVPPKSTLVEFGSGSSLKTRFLLDALDSSVVYVPVDVSSTHLFESAELLRDSYPDLRIDPVVADFTEPIRFPESVDPDLPVTIYFPGSTLGNFSPDESAGLLEIIVGEIGTCGGLILGLDLQKDKELIEAAYNDKQGVTAEFNLNLLRRINRELDGDFELENFRHQSIYNADLGRIETSIVSLQDQEVSVADQQFEFFEGEEIHTEYSYKYRLDEFATFASRFGLNLNQVWTDRKGYFAVLHLDVNNQHGKTDESEME